VTKAGAKKTYNQLSGFAAGRMMKALTLMDTVTVAVAVFVANGSIFGLSEASQVAARVECHEVQECRRLALEAKERGAYETFHDFAWRTTQTGRRNDPELMYLLARAQSLSNRPTDALVTLKRLAEMGVVYDTTTNEDLWAVRTLPGWPQVAALIDRVAGSGVPPPSPRAPAATPPKPTVLLGGPKIQGLTVVEAVHFSAPDYVPGGLAYDSVSRRFLVGDLYARKLLVVGEGSDHVIDMVRADSARFQDVTAIEIDPRRGDLWVVSTGPTGTGALHKLQLVSGRTLRVFEAASELQPVRFADVTVTPSGTVLVLDDVGRRVLGFRPKARTLAAMTRLEVEAPTSLAVSGDGKVAYVAHRDGLVQLDLATRLPSAIAAPDGVDLGHFERIRWHRNALVGAQVTPNGARRFVRLRLSPTGRRVTEATVIDATLPAGSGPTFATITGDDLYYLVTKSAASGIRRDHAPGREIVDVLVQRVRLR
jgi:DNA-binding beta-propeller fold protein YncE